MTFTQWLKQLFELEPHKDDAEQVRELLGSHPPLSKRQFKKRYGNNKKRK